jgi:uncharacterized protein YdhG (YjbR/CyaY superfamily)
MNVTVQQYFDSTPEDRKPYLRKLHELVLSVDPSLEPVMYYNLPTYKSGKGQVSIGNQPKFLTLYTTGPQYIAGFKEKHPKYKTGKASINLYVDDPWPMEDLKEVIERALGFKNS